MDDLRYFPEIDFEKSIKKERLVYKLTADVVFDYVFFYAGGFFLIAIITLFIPMMVNGISDESKLIIIICGLVALDIWMGLNLILCNRLLCIKGNDLESNKKNMLQVLDDVYNNIESANIYNNSIKYIRPPDNRWGRRITTLYEGEGVYINITTLGRSNGTSFIHGFSNYLKCRRIAASFHEQYP